MATIQVTPDMLKSKATELRSIKEEHDEAMSKMKTLVTGLPEIFKGDAADAFISKYESMQGTFTEFSELLESFATKLDTAATQFQETDTVMKTQMGN
jgi:WXG100 family type VII secretion target